MQRRVPSKHWRMRCSLAFGCQTVDLAERAGSLMQDMTGYGSTMPWGEQRVRERERERGGTKTGRVSKDLISHSASSLQFSASNYVIVKSSLRCRYSAVCQRECQCLALDPFLRRFSPAIHVRGTTTPRTPGTRPPTRFCAPGPAKVRPMSHHARSGNSVSQRSSRTFFSSIHIACWILMFGLFSSITCLAYSAEYSTNSQICSHCAICRGSIN